MTSAFCLLRQVAKPSSALSGNGSVDVTIASTAFCSLQDAVLHVTRYPYECSEQIASRLLVMVTVKDIMESFVTNKVCFVLFYYI